MSNRYEINKTGRESWSVLDRWSGMYLISNESYQVCCNVEASLNAEANARLIAAAPELLEVLQALELAARIDCPRTDAWKNLLETAQATITKAEGRNV